MVETACVSFPRIALEYLDKLVCQHCRLPGFTRNHGFGNCQAHLCIISIATRLDVMPGMFHITGKVVMQANRLCICIFKTSSICIANSKFKQQVVLSPSRRIVKRLPPVNSVTYGIRSPPLGSALPAVVPAFSLSRSGRRGLREHSHQIYPLGADQRSAHPRSTSAG